MSQDTKERILAAGVTVFSDYGYHQASMDQIASAANVAKGTLYYNYPNKAHLFAELVDAGYSMMQSSVHQVTSTERSALENIRSALMAQLQILTRYAKLARIIYGELGVDFDPDAKQRLHAARRRYIGHLSQLLQQGIDQHCIASYDPQIMAFALVGALEGICNEAWREAIPLSQQRREDICELLLHGLAQ